MGVPRRFANYSPSTTSNPVRFAEGGELFDSLADARSGMAGPPHCSLGRAVQLIAELRIEIVRDANLAKSAAIYLGNSIIAGTEHGEWRVFAPDRPEVWLADHGIDPLTVVERIARTIPDGDHR